MSLQKLLNSYGMARWEKKEKASEELWMMSRGIALASGKTVTMALLVEALNDELAGFYPDYRKVHDRLEQQFLKA